MINKLKLIEYLSDHDTITKDDLYELGITYSTTKRTIKWLIEIGIIEDTAKFKIKLKRGIKLTNKYKINQERLKKMNIFDVYKELKKERVTDGPKLTDGPKYDISLMVQKRSTSSTVQTVPSSTSVLINSSTKRFGPDAQVPEYNKPFWLKVWSSNEVKSNEKFYKNNSNKLYKALETEIKEMHDFDRDFVLTQVFHNFKKL